VQLLKDLGGYSFVECRLETGRTHQIRIHLGEAGTPLCGERVYDRPVNAAPIPDASGAQRPMLHAVHLGFRHPTSSELLGWDAPLPPDMKELMARLEESKLTQDERKPDAGREDHADHG
jgi:23S rRNA pseudouridine1911/1915/1917 synthase